MLEAIFMVGRGRSFRSHRIAPVINESAQYLQVFAEAVEGEVRSKIGIRRYKKKSLVKIDGEVITRLSDIALKTPVQILTPKSHEMLERGPEYRRRFIEWGVFHVEHSYRETHKRFVRSLEQRNAELRRGGKLISFWDKDFVQAGNELEHARNHYFNLFAAEFDQIKYTYGLDDIALAWKPGWKLDLGLEESLKQGWLGDKKMGFTHSGPHRADLDIVQRGTKAVNALSRGQQKMLVIALNVVQAGLVKQHTGTAPIILMDDLASELDQDNRSLVMDQLQKQNCQCFITATEEERAMASKVFHVEHGKVSEIGQ